MANESRPSLEQVENTGDFDVTGILITGTLTVTTTGATVDPAFATSDYADIILAGGPAVANQAPFVIHTDDTLVCPGVIDGFLTLTTNEGVFDLPVTFPVELERDPCQAVTFPQVPPAITRLMAVRNGTDVDFSWDNEPLAISGYNIWYAVLDKTLIPLANINNRPPPPTNPANPVPQCADPQPALLESCTHFGAVDDPDYIHYYQVKGFCIGGEGP